MLLKICTVFRKRSMMVWVVQYFSRKQKFLRGGAIKLTFRSNPVRLTTEQILTICNKINLSNFVIYLSISNVFQNKICVPMIFKRKFHFKYKEKNWPRSMWTYDFFTRILIFILFKNIFHRLYSPNNHKAICVNKKWWNVKHLKCNKLE